MLGSLVAALRETLRALMRLLRGGATPEAGGREATSVGPASGVTEAGAAGAPDGAGWSLPYEDPLVFPSATLKSVESRHSLFLRFINSTEEPVRIFWIDYGGSPVRYKTIEAGRSHRQQSFLSHPWTACCVNPPATRLVLNGQPAIFPLADAEAPASVEGVGATPADGDDAREVMTVSIERPPPLAWATASHARFPACFRDAARAFVLAHARLAAEAADGSPGERSPGGAALARATLGHLPVHLRDVIIAMAAPVLPLYLPVRMPRPQTPELPA